MKTVGDAAKFLSGGTPKKSNDAFWNGDIPWFSASNMSDKFLATSDLSITEQGLKAGSRMAPLGATLLLVRGSGLFNHIPICFADRDVAFNQDVKAIIAKDGVDPLYLHYTLEAHRRELANNLGVTGIGAGKFDTDFLKQLNFVHRDQGEQEEIGRLASAYDRKIELNRRMNETLEEMARAVFRDWFVDFGPTRRQMEGATDPAAIIGHAFPPEKAATLAPLFPAKLGDDGLPEGWEKQKIEHALNRLKVGKLYNQKAALNEGKVPILDQGKFGVIGYHNNEPNIVASSNDRVAIFANHTCVQRLLDHPFSTIQNVIPYRGRELPTEWCHYATLGQQAFEEYKGHWPTFVSKEIVKPSRESAIVFAEFVHPLLLRISANGQENQTLAALRDLLLPKLMSGEIRLKDAEGKV